MKIFFMGGHKLGQLSLKKLIDNNKDIIGAVVTDTDDPWYSGVDEIALKNNIPLFRQSNINNQQFLEVVDSLSPDLITSVNFNQILGKKIIQIPKQGCINIHASLLPNYRGRAPLNWAVINGEDETGVTVHYIDEGIDTGDIILQKRIKIEEHDYIKDILAKVERIYPEILLEGVELIENKKVNPFPQRKNEGSYFTRRRPDDGRINWNSTARDIYNFIRAISHPYPGAFSYLKGEKLIIWHASLYNANVDIPHGEIENGQVVEANNQGIVVKADDGFLLLDDIEYNVSIKVNDIL